MGMEFNEYTLFAMEIAREAGAELMRRFSHNHVVGTKTTPTDLVTESDFASERILVARIKERFPGHHILTEEGSERGALDEEWLWVIDPLDGTVNYAHGLPIFSVSIALAHRGSVVSGAVYDPTRDVMYAAERGKGAWRNGKPIRVSETRSLSQAMLATGFPYQIEGNPDNNLREFGLLMARAQTVRRPGSAALDLAWVAEGVFDGFWEPGLKPWDCAAGVLLVEEAGGTATDYEGRPWNLSALRIALTNGLIHGELLAALSQA